MKTDLEELLIETERRRASKKATKNSLFAVISVALLISISRYTSIVITDDMVGFLLLFCATYNLLGLAKLIQFGVFQKIPQLTLMLANLGIALMGFILGGAMIFFRH